MSEFYSDAHRALQDRFDTRRTADALHDNVLRHALLPVDRAFIEAADFFFLSTVDHSGFPSVSHKGGFPGFVRVLDDRTLAFPVYDGNGMFYSLGNLADSGKVGMLFIDFEHPRRLRLHGSASIDPDDPLAREYDRALTIVRVQLETIFTNCPRYIHRYKRIEPSPHVPQDGAKVPVPQWKQVDYLNESLSDSDPQKAEAAADPLTETEYRRDFWKGLE